MRSIAQRSVMSGNGFCRKLWTAAGHRRAGDERLNHDPGFHHVAIRAVDFDATVKFYTEGLGCTVHYGFSVPGRMDRAAFLDAGDGRY